MKALAWIFACAVPLLIGWGFFAALRWSKTESEALLASRPDAKFTDGGTELLKGNIKVGLKRYLLAPQHPFYDKLGKFLIMATLTCCGAGILFLVVYFSSL